MAIKLRENNLKEHLESLMNKPRAVRNVSIIGQMNHGKSTLVDTLTSYTEDEEEEDKRFHYPDVKMTIKSKPYTVIYRLPEENMQLIRDLDQKEPDVDKFLITIMDTPGHVDFSAEVSAALRITDGAIIVVDCISGCCVQTENVIKQAIYEKVKPVLFLNKMGRAFFEFCLEKEELYQLLNKTIETINIISATYSCDDNDMKELPVDPSKGTVVFGSGLDEWAFSIRDFANIYSSIFSASTAKVMDKLWGNDFFNKLKWTKVKKDNTERGFNMFILDPIFKIFDAIVNFRKSETEQLLQTLKIELSAEDLKKEGRDLLRVVMNSWLPATDALFKLIAIQLPSPVTAQKQRAKFLYEGPSNDVAFHGIVNCDDEGPLMVYVSKMIPSDAGRRFYALGRVFSGRLTAGQNVRFMGPKYKPLTNDDLQMKDTGQPVILTGDTVEHVESVPAGNICGITGTDQYLVKTGTISNFRDAFIFKNMNFSVSPVVQISVEPFNSSELPQFSEGLRRLIKADALVEHVIEDNGKHVLCVSGEEHMKTCLKDLEDEYAAITMKYSDPAVAVRETVTRESTEICSAKSPNQHNRLFMTAQPLLEDLVLDIENKKITEQDDHKRWKEYLKGNHNFDPNDAINIWSFGPDHDGPNLLIDKSKGIKQIKDIQTSVISAFQIATKGGVLCEEPTRGVRFNLCDATFFGDLTLRDSGQIIPTAIRTLQASLLTACPCIQEPVFLCEVQCPMNFLRTTYDILSQRKGIVYEEHQVTGTSIYILRAQLPALESFGLNDELLTDTEGQTSCQCVFDHWQRMKGNPLDAVKSSNAYNLVMSIRKRKGLKESLPDPADFIDKL